MIVTSVILLPVGLILTFFAWLSAGVGSIGNRELLVQLCLTLPVAVVPALVLLGMSVVGRLREPGAGLPVAGLVVGAICAVVGSALILPTLIGSAQQQIRVDELSSRPPTAAETAYTADGAADLAEQLLVDSRRALVDAGFEVVKPADPDRSVRPGCVLSNLDHGSDALVSLRIDVAAGDGEPGVAAIADHWRTLGLDVTQTEGSEFRADLDYGRVVVRWNEAAQSIAVQMQSDCFDD
jgi:hypothetical protein